MDLLTPTDHAGAYEWASVFLAHFAIGFVLVPLLCAFLEWWAGEWIDDLGGVSVALIVAGYALIWEGLVQQLGAGWLDAGVDALAVTCGAVMVWSAWSRWPVKMALVAMLAAAALWAGVRVRK